MTPYANLPPFQKNLWSWLILIFTCLIFGALAINISHWFIVPAFLIFFGSLPLLNSIACPRCGTSLNSPGFLLGIPVASGWRRKKCIKCGLDLTKSYQAN
jgi:hypothetical protein